MFLEFNQKKNLRSLSNEQTQELENIKSRILFNIQPYSAISHQMVHDILNDCHGSKMASIMSSYDKWKNNIQNSLNRSLTLDEQKYAKSSFYAVVYNK